MARLDDDLPKPFLKYPGGKTHLAVRVLDALDLRPTDTLVEPFLGGGAVTLAALHRRARVVAGDASAHLVEIWRTVMTEGHTAIWAAEVYLARVTDAESYYDLRRKYNDTRDAAMALALNRACFNGLWRFNAAGEFNVPWGKRPQTTFPPHVGGTAEWLRNRYLRSPGSLVVRRGDWREVLRAAPTGAVAYLDPPYSPAGAARPFVAYGAPGWTYQSTVALVDEVTALVRRGDLRRAVLSYMDSPELAEHLTRQGWKVEYVNMTRSISRKGDGRGSVRESFASICGAQ